MPCRVFFYLSSLFLSCDFFSFSLPSIIPHYCIVPFSHSLAAYDALLIGLNKLELNKEALKNDLDQNWAVVAEAIQTILRREGYPKPYEALKELTRTGTKITQNEIINFINSLYLKSSVKDELRKITPFNYTGMTEIK